MIVQLMVRKDDKQTPAGASTAGPVTAVYPVGCSPKSNNVILVTARRPPTSLVRATVFLDPGCTGTFFSLLLPVNECVPVFTYVLIVNRYLEPPTMWVTVGCMVHVTSQSQVKTTFASLSTLSRTITTT